MFHSTHAPTFACFFLLEDHYYGLKNPLVSIATLPTLIQILEENRTYCQQMSIIYPASYNRLLKTARCDNQSNK